jgi:hypothetical protein
MRKAVSLLLLLTFPALGAGGEWDSLQALRAGERIWVRFQTQEKVRSAKGDFMGWTPDNLIVRLGRTETVIARGDVRRIAVYAGKSRKKGAGLGALVGGAAGAVFYGAAVATVDDLDVSPAAVVAAGSLVFAGVGALIGLAVGSTKVQTLYETPAAVPAASR